jgi:hypothetical protein
LKRTILTLLVFLFSVPIGFARQNATNPPVFKADAAASSEDIENYFATMHAQEMIKSMMDKMTSQVQQMIHQQIQNQPNLPPEFEARMEKMIDDTFKGLPVDELLQTMIPVYQKHYSKGDIEALTAFYSTPWGQRILKELPEVTAESMQASSGIMQKKMGQTMQRVQAEIAELQKSSDGISTKQSSPAPN